MPHESKDLQSALVPLDYYDICIDRGPSKFL